MLPQGDDAGLLAMPRTQAVLRVKSTNVHEQDLTPLEYVITRFRADRIQLCINP
jgi:GntR family phosphonate transport system transcriptional regulator